MNIEGSAKLLDAWERGTALPPVQRPVALLSTLRRHAADEVAVWPVGRRDATLLEIQHDVFGSSLQCIGTCPECHVPLEFDTPVPQLEPVARGWSDSAVKEIASHDWQIRFRLLNTMDLAEAGRASTVEVARMHLIQASCLAIQRPDGTPARAADLPAEVQSDLAAALEAADPFADIHFDLKCPDCGHAWQSPFDIASFLWTCVEYAASETLSEVHLLAREYGWSETEILRLSPVRRRHYLNFVEA